jgi:hypothetical protein
LQRNQLTSKEPHPSDIKNPAIAAAEASQHDLSAELWSSIMGAELIEFSRTYSRGET